MTHQVEFDEVREAVEPEIRVSSKFKKVSSSKEWEEIETTDRHLTLFGSRFAGLMLATDLMRHVGELSDVTAAQVKESRSEYIKANDSLAPFKRMLDVYVSHWFGNDGQIKGKKKKTGSSPALEFLQSGEAEAFINTKDLSKSLDKLSVIDRKIVQTAMAAVKEKRFFHWELEFPEVFYRKGKEKENPGFDAVIGNPPYVGFRDFEYDKDYVVKRFNCATARFDLYMPFLEYCTKIVCQKGLFSFICPSTFLLREHGRELRQVLAASAELVRYHDFGDFSVFEGAQNYTCICVFKNGEKTENVNYSNGPFLTTPQKLKFKLTDDV